MSPPVRIAPNPHPERMLKPHRTWQDAMAYVRKQLRAEMQRQARAAAHFTAHPDGTLTCRHGHVVPDGDLVQHLHQEYQ
ncbi:hypothetical protein ACPL7H_18215 [Pseudactinotalea sp. Z1732]